MEERIEPNREQKNRNKQQKKNQSEKKVIRNFLSIVIPLYNEEESLKPLVEQVEKAMTELMGDKWEIIFVDDGSTDNSYEILKEIAKTNYHRFKCIRFRKNFGKSAALSAGFLHCSGSYVATMDADLQDDPKEFANMFAKLNEGYDLVSGWKKKRHDPISKTIPSKFFNFVTSICSGIKLHDFNCGIKLYRREVVTSLEVYGEMHRYLPALAHWNGFKVTEVPVEHHERQFGKSKFGISRFMRGFLDLLTFVFTTRFIKRPMHFFGTLGMLCGLVGGIAFVYLCIEWFLGWIYLSERPLAWFALGLVIMGIQFFSIGLIGELLVKQNFSRKNQYEIKNTIGIKRQEQ